MTTTRDAVRPAVRDVVRDVTDGLSDGPVANPELITDTTHTLGGDWVYNGDGTYTNPGLAAGGYLDFTVPGMQIGVTYDIVVTVLSAVPTTGKLMWGPYWNRNGITNNGGQTIDPTDTVRSWAEQYYGVVASNRTMRLLNRSSTGAYSISVSLKEAA